MRRTTARNGQRQAGYADAVDALRQGEDPAALRAYAVQGRSLCADLYDLDGDREEWNRAQYFAGILEAVDGWTE